MHYCAYIKRKYASFLFDAIVECALMEQQTSKSEWRKFFPTAFGDGRHVTPGLNQLLQPEGLDPDTVRRWLKTKAEELGITATSWARAAGLAPSTLNRFIAGKGPSNLTAATISALGEAAIAHFGRTIALRASERPELKDRARFCFDVPVIASLETEPCRGNFEWEARRDYKLTVPLPIDLVGAATFGFEVSKFKFFGFSPGTVLICIPAATLSYELASNRRFIYHQKLNDGSIKTTLRKMLIDPDGLVWAVRLNEEDSAPAFFLGEVDAREALKFNSNDAFISFALVLTLQAEPWARYEWPYAHKSA